MSELTKNFVKGHLWECANCLKLNSVPNSHTQFLRPSMEFLSSFKAFNYLLDIGNGYIGVLGHPGLFLGRFYSSKLLVFPVLGHKKVLVFMNINSMIFFREEDRVSFTPRSMTTFA